MPSTYSASSPAVHALLHEKLDALLAECNLVMDTAAFGQTVHNLDDFFCTKGQQFIQEVFQEKLQERIAQAEQQNEHKQCPHCKKKRHARKTRNRKR